MTMVPPVGAAVFSPCRETLTKIVDLEGSSGEAHVPVVGHEAGEVVSAIQEQANATPPVVEEVPSGQ